MAAQKKADAGRHSVTVAGVDYHFELYTSRRKTMTLRVRADGRLTVDAPTGVALPLIYDFVRTRTAWIDRHQSRLRERVTAHPERHYQDGERWPYLGEHYTLRVTVGTNEGVTLTDSEIRVMASTPARVAGVLRGWYGKRAQTFFAERISALMPLAASVGIPAPERLVVREMVSRWGSCSGRGRVALNLKLIQLQPALIDYVILHELCHLRELNHSPRYYALLAAVLPEWKRRRLALRSTPIRFET